MTITNNLNLPEALVEVCSGEKHNKEGYSATTLLQGTKQIILSERHWNEMSDDVSDRIWAIFGTAVHALLEKESKTTFTEEKLDYTLDNVIITGKFDCYDYEEKCVYDYKTASVWKVQFKDFQDWEKQGLTYAWLLTKCGFEVEKCRFIALLKDHSKSKARYDSQYPQSPVYVHEFFVTEEKLKETEKQLLEKVHDITEKKALPDDEIPECTAEERWAKETKWAAMKQGRKSAIKLFDNKEDCESFVAKKGGYVEERKGESTKCLGYCPCKNFCSFYKKTCARRRRKGVNMYHDTPWDGRPNYERGSTEEKIYDDYLWELYRMHDEEEEDDDEPLEHNTDDYED